MKDREHAYNAREVMQLDIARLLHILYLDAKAEEELNDWTAEEDYQLESDASSKGEKRSRDNERD